MPFFRSKQKTVGDTEGANYREPIKGSRKVSWDRTAHSSQPISLLAPSGQSFLPATDPTVSHTRSHSRKPSVVQSNLDGHTRRSSYQTDTTSRSIDPEARSIRVRKSDMFRSRPRLRYKQPAEYTRTPQGHLPTLHKGSNSAFIDDLADELDTSELRNVLETDLRRKRRRQSAIESTSKHKSLHTAPAIPSNYRNQSSLENSHQATVYLGNQNNSTIQKKLSSDGLSQVEISSVMPVYSGNDKSLRLESPAVPASTMPGDWYDADSLVKVQKRQEMYGSESHVVLAGNRESFPDFSVEDRSNVPRDSHSSLRLANAWSSLWRRASIARVKKENDVAQHRTRRLEGLQNATHYRTALASPLSAESDRRGSNSSYVLYETLEDLPRPGELQRTSSSGYGHQQSSERDFFEEEIPTDAFYDPNTAHRPASSRNTHSRNFSRPRNESQMSQYKSLESTRQVPVTVTKKEAAIATFSPLLNGDAFPKPEERVIPTHVMGAYHSIGNTYPHRNEMFSGDTEVVYPQTTIGSSMVGSGFTSPSEAAGPQRLPSMAYQLPTTPVHSSMDSGPVPSESLLYESNKMTTPPHSADHIALSLGRPSMQRSVTHTSIHSLQSLDSQGSWLSKRRSELDDVVRQSFSRNLVNRPTSFGGRSYQSIRLLSAASHLRERPVSGISSSSAGTSLDIDYADSDVADNGAADELLNSATSRDLNDDAEYEQGIWRTGVGKTVQVIASPLRSHSGNGPVVIDHTEIPSVTHSRGSSIDHQQARLAQLGLTNGNASRDTVVAQAPELVQRESYMTSVNSFHTAQVFSASQSEASSRTTLRQDM